MCFTSPSHFNSYMLGDAYIADSHRTLSWSVCNLKRVRENCKLSNTVVVAYTADNMICEYMLTLVSKL